LSVKALKKIITIIEDVTNILWRNIEAFCRSR